MSCNGLLCCRAAAIRALLRDEARLFSERAALAAKRTAYRGYARGDLPGDGRASFSVEGGRTPQLRRTVGVHLSVGRLVLFCACTRVMVIHRLG